MNERARELIGDREAVFSMTQGRVAEFDMDDFARFVELAAGYGATHIDVGMFPYRYTWFLPDNKDPYAAWCNTHMGVLRVFPPEELQEWVPGDTAEQYQEFLERKLELIRPYGLKAAADGVEPLWLPEGVYRAHPRWRGAQCELGRIAQRPYFAPSIDEPEVLDIYRKAMCAMAERFPEIERFNFMSNDSGAGMSWSPCLYPGMNGPTWWRTRDAGQRISNWMRTMRQGAQEGGVEAKINIFSSGLPADTVASVREKLDEGLFVNFKDAQNRPWHAVKANLSGGLWSTAYPAVGLGDPEQFISGLQSVYHNTDKSAPSVAVGFDSEDISLVKTLMESYFEHPESDRMSRTRALVRAAESVCGSDSHADSLISIWERVAKAQHAIQQVRQHGFGLVLPFCCTSMRWLIRPLVPQPEQLTESETDYWHRCMFTTGTKEQNANLGYVLGKQVFRGAGAVWMARWCLEEAVGTLKGARASAQKLADGLDDPQVASRLSLYAARIGALACLAANARNTIMYQYALDTASQPQYGPNQMDYDDNIIYDQRALRFRKIAREELDNMTELIELIESQSGTVIKHADSPDEENVFLLGPDVVSQLRRKMNIMLDHWQDYEDIYPATKVHEFEPEPEGNLDTEQDSPECGDSH